ncbi:MAG: UTP--glucose-1-phosphate uridylyltransferase [Deferrisomatales bacterium]|nr:UTP--glucose-1-phosphate uridylyltransferase [Deferrisomatales bacterium]
MEPRDALEVLRERNRQGQVHREAVEAFERMYRAYRSGADGRIPWGEISPAGEGDIVSLEQFKTPQAMAAGERHLGEVAWIVLNGGLGTSMKMERAKSLVPVKGANSFLDLIAEHVLGLRRRYGVELPLVFMNSFATRDDTLRALARHQLAVGGRDGNPLPLDFVQHRFPRIREVDGLPFGEAGDRDAWAPPGHGNLYLALRCSGLLDQLLGYGIRWVFVSNADNLGATPHPGLLHHLMTSGLEFAMEVTAKTAADVKGGTLVRRGGRLQLLEIAQVEDEHRAEFQDLGTFPVFNTNNLWVDLAALAHRLQAGSLDLPLIVNRKAVGDVAVVQLETAMGAAIGQFERAAGVLVGRDRFAPVKTIDDLLVRRSDAYLRGEASPLVVNPARAATLGPPLVALDPRHYGSVADLDRRVPVAPSLVGARSLRVEGDVHFGRGVQVRGDVVVRAADGAALVIEDGAVLSG